ncbi:MAG: hypothetical protein PHV54_02970 [Tolumonas sp.]|nr:hypothetical protein [Tolumonas sp.]
MDELTIKEKIALYLYRRGEWLTTKQIAHNLCLENAQVYRSMLNILSDEKLDADQKDAQKNDFSYGDTELVYRVFDISEELKQKAYLIRMPVRTETIRMVTPGDIDINSMVKHHNPLWHLITCHRNGDLA